MYPSTNTPNQQLDRGAFFRAVSGIVNVFRPLSLNVPTVDVSAERHEAAMRLRDALFQHVNSDIKLIAGRMFDFIEQSYISQFDTLMRTLSTSDMDALIRELRAVTDSINADSVSNQVQDLQHIFTGIIKSWADKHLYNAFDTRVPNVAPLILPKAFINKCVSRGTVRGDASQKSSIVVDDDLFCEISMSLLTNPVMIRASGRIINYDCLLSWISEQQREYRRDIVCPFTRTKIDVRNPIVASDECDAIRERIRDIAINHGLRHLIDFQMVYPGIDATNDAIDAVYKSDRAVCLDDDYVSKHSGLMMTHPVRFPTSDDSSMAVDAADLDDVLPEACIRAAQEGVFELKFGDEIVMSEQLDDVDDKIQKIDYHVLSFLDSIVSDDKLIRFLQFYVDDLNTSSLQDDSSDTSSIANSIR